MKNYTRLVYTDRLKANLQIVTIVMNYLMSDILFVNAEWGRGALKKLSREGGFSEREMGFAKVRGGRVHFRGIWVFGKNLSTE